MNFKSLYALSLGADLHYQDCKGAHAAQGMKPDGPLSSGCKRKILAGVERCSLHTTYTINDK